jgi:hypothetical protein
MPRRAAQALLAALLLLVLALRAGAVFTTNVHWDEFVLLDQADVSLGSGRLEAAGRPGLAVALLLPFVADCDDEIQVVRRARLLWLGLTCAWLLGVAAWLGQLSPDPRSRRHDAALGLALLALVPAFLDASLQLRTDHLALLGGSWGGALLLASRRRAWLAAAAGACFAVGFLGSQKVVYLAALAGLLALARPWLEPPENRATIRALDAARAFGLRAGLAAAAACITVVGFRQAIGLAFEVPETSPARTAIDLAHVEHGISLFEFYRRTIGWSEYRGLLPSLLPHALLLVALGAATFAALREYRHLARRLSLAWAVLALGAAVAAFHAAAFRYFWLTLGLFPAAAFALARGALVAQVPARYRRLVVMGFWCLLLAPAALHMALQLSDRQAVQRESLRFVHANFPRDAAGFHPESGLFCQAGRKPFPTLLSQHLHLRFAGPRRELHTQRMLARFRDTPVEFLLQSFRLNQLPVEVRRFLAENYQPYRAAVFVAGRRLAGAGGEQVEFELVVPGRYRWLPEGGPKRLAIGGRVLEPGGVTWLDRGIHRARFVEDGAEGRLVLALREPPSEAPLPFYWQP